MQLLERKSAVLPIAFDFRQAQKHRKPVQKRLCPSTFEIVLPFEKSLHASAGSSEQLPFQADAQKTAPLLHRGHRVPCRSAPAAGSFVKHDFRNAYKPLQGIALSHQETMFGCVSDGCHNCGWGCQHQGTRTKYNQDGNGSNNLPTQ